MPSIAGSPKLPPSAGLSCLLIHNGIASEVIQRLSSGRLSIGYHLDYFALWHVSDDPLARLAFAVQDAGGRPVNPPARSRTFTDKASAHAELLRHGLGVPATVLLRPWSGDRPLTVAERRQLRLDEPGARLYLKPANGFSGRGIVRVEDVRPENLAVQLAAARQFDRQDTYLIQREVRFPWLPCEDGTSRPAYWRILSYLGELTVFWWSPWESAHPERPSYRAVTETELHRHRLQPLLAYAQELDHLSGLDWFSTELCLSDGPEMSRFTITGADGRERPVLAIDYLNDQCDVDVQSRWQGAPPDAYVYYLRGTICSRGVASATISVAADGNRGACASRESATPTESAPCSWAITPTASRTTGSKTRLPSSPTSAIAASH